MTVPTCIREATASDLETMFEVQAACRDAPQWSPAHYEEMLSGKASGGRQRKAFVAERDGKLMGYAVASAVADEAELESVAVLPAARRQGLAWALCSASLAWAARAGASEMWLEVRSASEGAQALYRQLGFVPMGIRRRYYADPEDDAALMKASLREAAHL